MIFVIYLFNCLVLNVHSTLGQVLLFGICDEVETVKYFDIEKFLGTWYEIERYPTWYESYGHCAYKKINYCDCNIEIEHGFVKDHIRYVLHVNTTYNHGAEAIFRIDANNVDPVGTPLSVIATNYENYAVIYGCKYDESLDIKYVSVWILSRLTTLSVEHLATTYDIVSTIPQISTAYFENVDHSEDICRHYWTAHVQAENTTDWNTYGFQQYLLKSKER